MKILSIADMGTHKVANLSVSHPEWKQVDVLIFPEFYGYDDLKNGDTLENVYIKFGEKYNTLYDKFKARNLKDKTIRDNLYTE